MIHSIHSALAVGLLVIAPAAARASLVIAHEDERTSGNTGALEKLGDDIAAQAGDVLVITAAKSKGLTYTYAVTSTDGGAASALTHHAFDGVNKTLNLVTFDITTGGTFDFDATPASTSFTTFGAYLLRADYGAGESITLLDSDGNFRAANEASPHTSSLSFAESSGIVIEAYSSGSTTGIPAGALPTGLDGFINGGDNRATATGTFTDANSLSFDWVVNDITKNSRTAGIAFTAVPEASAILSFSAVGMLVFGRVGLQRLRHRSQAK